MQESEIVSAQRSVVLCYALLSRIRTFAGSRPFGQQFVQFMMPSI